MAEIAVLGTGAMGARMAERLIAAGHRVRVWNRAKARAEPLVARGAVWAETPRAAADGADAAIAMLRDDAASEAVWLDAETGALAGLPDGALMIECSTLSVPFARALSARAAAQGRRFLDAPVAGSRPQAEAGQLIFLVGGAASTLETARPWLEVMGGAVHHAGPAGAGAVVKLMVNALFAAQLAATAELIGLARGSDVDPATAVEIISATPVASPAVKGAAQAMLARAFAPAFPIELVEKDMGLLLRSAEAAGADAPISAAVRSVFQQAITAGFGGDNITGVAQLYDRPASGA